MSAELEALRAGIREDMADAIAEGMRRVLKDPEILAGVMDTVVETAQRKAAERTGLAFFGLLRSLVSKWILIGALVLMALKLAGVEVAAKVWRLLTGGAP